jgi:hypothetical protein
VAKVPTPTREDVGNSGELMDPGEGRAAAAAAAMRIREHRWRWGQVEVERQASWRPSPLTPLRQQKPTAARIRRNSNLLKTTYNH